MGKKSIDIVVPCFNEQDCIKAFVIAINQEVQKNNNFYWKIIFIDDGSSDHTLDEIKRCSNLYEEIIPIKYISFARNFGKEAALYAGLQKSDADYTIVMDADLQHPPMLISEMLKLLECEDYDCIGARRISRKGEPFIKSILSRGFYYVINWFTGMQLVPGMTDYRVMKRRVVKAIASMPERERFIKGIYSWVGFKTKWIEYENVERLHGTSKWSIKGLWNYAKSGFIAFATTPLRGVIYLGMMAVLASMVYAIKLLKDTLSGARQWQDTTTIILLVLFFGGITITVLGIIGEYIARIYMEVKERPIYITRESNL
ncbi:glycosyltransferase family 2 protein [Butyrivibrio sp. XBB1001]|uniref:glycosyltransferase family 2 protein n=1 Tax=Butyrivibrio sp. XBB1001 TaxID=1280682 RepID=UPI00041A6E93|nr:glycosyltransferase family 2 protein [Butyrivibrio sp. XBB1001]